MTVDDMNEALHAGKLLAPQMDACQVADVVYTTLSALAKRASWWQAPVLRTAAGLVSQWRRERCAR